MAQSPRYVLSPHRGLPSPLGRLGPTLGDSVTGGLVASWREAGGSAALPPPVVLQEPAETWATLDAAAQAARYVASLESAPAAPPAWSGAPPLPAPPLPRAPEEPATAVTLVGTVQRGPAVDGEGTHSLLGPSGWSRLQSRAVDLASFEGMRVVVTGSVRPVATGPGPLVEVLTIRPYLGIPEVTPAVRAPPRPVSPVPPREPQAGTQSRVAPARAPHPFAAADISGRSDATLLRPAPSLSQDYASLLQPLQPPRREDFRTNAEYVKALQEFRASQMPS